MRYVGQAFELSVEIDRKAIRSAGPAMLGEAFEREHERTYGHRFPGRRLIQIVSLAVTGVVPTMGREALLRETPDVAADGHLPARRPVYFGDAFGLLDTPVLRRKDLGWRPRNGPLIVEDADSTSVIPPDAEVSVSPHGHLIVRLGGLDDREPLDAR
jgi:N-methylhydantoinase A